MDASNKLFMSKAITEIRYDHKNLVSSKVKNALSKNSTAIAIDDVLNEIKEKKLNHPTSIYLNGNNLSFDSLEPITDFLGQTPAVYCIYMANNRLYEPANESEEKESQNQLQKILSIETLEYLYIQGNPVAGEDRFVGEIWLTKKFLPSIDLEIAKKLIWIEKEDIEYIEEYGNIVSDDIIKAHKLALP